MSLEYNVSQADALQSKLAECSAMLDDIQSKMGSINTQITAVNKESGGSSLPDTMVKTHDLQISSFELYLTVRRALAAIQRLGIPEDISEAINKVQRLIMVIHTLMIAMTALEMTSTWGIIKGGITIFSAVTQIYAMGDRL